MKGVAPAAGRRGAQVDQAAGKQDDQLRGDRGGAMVPESQPDLRRASSRSERQVRGGLEEVRRGSTVYFLYFGDHAIGIGDSTLQSSMTLTVREAR